MMKKQELRIESSKPIALDTVEMTLSNAYISKAAKPGQFLHIHVANHTLRRPISIADIDPKKETITIIFKIIGSGTKELATYQPGMKVNALGPNGNGFYLENDLASTVLLIGGGVGVPPLYYLGKTLAKEKIKVISVLGFQTADSVFYEEKFSELGETHVVTNDGSYGEKGFVTDVFPKLENFNRYYSCGPLPMLQAVTKNLAEKQGYVSLEEHMGCGVGACFACVIPTDNRGGYKKICQDGPVFPAQEVIL